MVDAQTETEREAAEKKLAQLQHEQSELETKLRNAKTAAETARAAATPQVDRGCKASPTAVGCS